MSKRVFNLVVNEETRAHVVKEHIKVEIEPNWEFVASEHSEPSLENVLKKNYANVLSFYLNGEEQVLESVDPSMRLVDYIRQQGLTGTKIGCGEGGCGACTVLITYPSSSKKQNAEKAIAINSCLRPLGSVNGCHIDTVESLGSSKNGFSDVQNKIADCNATQCGYCTPGWVVAMQDLLEVDPKPSMETVENHFDGNICRCTGYRSILAAMHSFSAEKNDDTEESHCTSGQNCVRDMEDITCCKKKTAKKIMTKKIKKTIGTYTPLQASESKGDGEERFTPLSFQHSNIRYYQVNTLKHAFKILEQAKDVPHRIMVGNTSEGVVKYYTEDTLHDRPQVYIDISHIPELNVIQKTQSGINFGAAVCLNDVILTLKHVMTKQKENPFKQVSSCSSSKKNNQIELMDFSNNIKSFEALLRHLKYVANNQVRNVASWAGNLMMNKYHSDFISDLLTLFAGYGAEITLATASGKKKTLDMVDWQDHTLIGNEIVVNLFIPFCLPDTVFNSFKVAARHNNSHAIVNSAFLVKQKDGCCSDIRMVFGGVHKNSLFWPRDTMQNLIGKPLYDDNTLQSTLNDLKFELSAVEGLGDYHRKLCLSFLFKFFLGIQKTLPVQLKSASIPYVREVSKGFHVYSDPDPKLEPVSDPVTKLSAHIQASGEAQFTDDVAMGEFPNALTGYFVRSSIAKGSIKSIDASAALQMEGVKTFISAETLAEYKFGNDCGAFPGDEELFSTGDINWVGQIIGMIVADNEAHAKKAAEKVKVAYNVDPAPPILTIEDAIAHNSYLLPNQYQKYTKKLETGNIEDGFKKAARIIEGELSTKAQYHFSLETQVSIAIPHEDQKMTIYSSAQGPADVRRNVAALMKLPANKVSVITKRLGGAFGGKISRNIPVALAVAVGSWKTNQPVRMQLDRTTDMETTGKRHPFKCIYKAGVDEKGKIIALDVKFYCNAGYTYDGSFGCMEMCMNWADNCYYLPNYRAQAYVCRTNLPSNTSMRTPGAANGIFFMESIVEDIASNLSVDALSIRELNFYEKGQTTPYGESVTDWNLPEPLTEVKEMSDYENRIALVQTFNKKNRWRKRGISCIPVKYGIAQMGYQESVLLNVCGEDGTIQLTTSGTEMGQGLFTKVAQSVAYALDVPLSIITVLPTSTEKTPNFTVTGGSATSECCAAAGLLAAKELMDRLQPFKEQNPKDDWKEIIAKASAASVSLSVVGKYVPDTISVPFLYYAYGACVSEVEIDVLTGEIEILRTDLVYDGGRPLNPKVDLGQIEGAFVLALGQSLTEDFITDKSGQISSLGTWEYKPPQSRDIPIQFNAQFVKNTHCPKGVLGSKAVGEPPYIFANSVVFALRNAIMEARKESRRTETSLSLNLPVTVESIQLHCGVDESNFHLHC